MAPNVKQGGSHHPVCEKWQLVWLSFGQGVPDYYKLSDSAVIAQRQGDDYDQMILSVCGGENASRRVTEVSAENFFN